MPSYTLGNMMSFATANAGRRADIGESDASRLVNEAYFEVAQASNPRGLESLKTFSIDSGADDYVLSLPSDFLEPITLALIKPSTSTASSQVSSWQTLRRMSLADLDASGSSTTGTPKKFAWYGSSIELWPSPDSKYSLQMRYRAQPSDLTSTDAVPSVDTPWRQAIVLKTEEKIHNFVGDLAKAQFANGRYLQYVSQLKTDEARRQSAEHPPSISMTAYSNRGRRKLG